MHLLAIVHPLQTKEDLNEQAEQDPLKLQESPIRKSLAKALNCMQLLKDRLICIIHGVLKMHG